MTPMFCPLTYEFTYQPPHSPESSRFNEVTDLILIDVATSRYLQNSTSQEQKHEVAPAKDRRDRASRQLGRKQDRPAQPV